MPNGVGRPSAGAERYQADGGGIEDLPGGLSGVENVGAPARPQGRQAWLCPSHGATARVIGRPVSRSLPGRGDPWGIRASGAKLGEEGSAGLEGFSPGHDGAAFALHAGVRSVSRLPEPIASETLERLRAVGVGAHRCGWSVAAGADTWLKDLVTGRGTFDRG